MAHPQSINIEPFVRYLPTGRAWSNLDTPGVLTGLSLSSDGLSSLTCNLDVGQGQSGGDRLTVLPPTIAPLHKLLRVVYGDTIRRFRMGVAAPSNCLASHGGGPSMAWWRPPIVYGLIEPRLTLIDLKSSSNLGRDVVEWERKMRRLGRLPFLLNEVVAMVLLTTVGTTLTHRVLFASTAACTTCAPSPHVYALSTQQRMRRGEVRMIWRPWCFSSDEWGHGGSWSRFGCLALGSAAGLTDHTGLQISQTVVGS